MKVKIDDNRIILTDSPYLRWLFGLLFALAGLQVLIPSLLMLSWSGVFTALFGLVFVLAGYQAGLSALYQKITIDRWLKKITVRKIGLTHFSKAEYSTDEIEKFHSLTETDSENSTSHGIWLSFKNGQSLILGTTFSSKAECETIINAAQEFFKQIEFPDGYQPKYLDSSVKFSKRKMKSRRK